MNFFYGAFAPRSKNDGTPWHLLWRSVPVLVFCVLFFGYRAGVEGKTASRQRTSFGIIGECERHGRGNDNYCHYTFPVDDEQHVGVDRAESEASFGQTVVVYYDSQDPRVNALEDFSEQSRKNRRFVYIFLLVLAAVVVAIAWSRAAYRKMLGDGLSPRGPE